MKKKFFRKIFITGASGFIGSHLTESLLNDGYKVRAFVRYTSNKNIGWLSDIKHHKNLEIVYGDITNYDSVKKGLKECDAIVNLAAMISVAYSFENPSIFYDVNVNGLLNLTRAALEQKKIKKILHISSSEVYGNLITKKNTVLNEPDMLDPESPYAASKIASESIAISLCKSNKLPIAIARPFNTFGPRQSLRAIIPTIITQMINQNKKKPVLKLGNIKPKRDLVYIDDTINGLKTILFEKKSIGKVFNISYGKSFSIKFFIDQISNYLRKSPTIKTDKSRLRKAEVYNLIGNNKKIKKELKWKPKYDSSKNYKVAIIKTINWFRESKNFSKYKNHINQYNM